MCMSSRRAFLRAFIALFILSLAVLSACGANAPAETPAPETPSLSPTPAVAELALTGGEKLDWPCGIPFEEPGYAAKSLTGQDITGEVKVTGEVDWMTPGEYELTYTVRQGKAEQAKAKRLVSVNAVGYPEVKATDGKVIYLTFDDGPSEYTPLLLEMLERHNAKATFFVITGNNKYLDTLLPVIYAAGHSVAVHAQNHEYDVLYSGSEYYLNDLNAARQRVYELTGEYVNLCRFPGGSATAYYKLNNREEGAWGTVTAQLERMGIQYVDWNINPENSINSGVSVVNSVKLFSAKYDTPLPLQHDTRLYSVKAVEDILIWARKTATPSSVSTQAYRRYILINKLLSARTQIRALFLCFIRLWGADMLL